MENKKVTVKELAQKLGVSISTVSKSLNDSYEISESTKIRVKNLAKKYNYTPNRLAVNLKSGKTRTIGVILPSILSNFFTTVLYGIEKVTNEQNYNIITCISNESHEKEVTNTKILSNGSIDGLIVAIAEETQIKKDFSHFQDCIHKGYPVVMFDRVTGSVECDKVVVDDFNDAYMASKHLLDLPCQRLALVSTIDFLGVGQMRVKGFEKAVKDRFGDVEQNKILKTNLASLEKEVVSLLDQHKIDGVFAVDEDSSLAVQKMAKLKGFNIPDDIAVIGYAGEKMAKNLSPTLTTVNQNGERIGEAAARILIDRLEGRSKDYVTKVISTNIEQRLSTKKNAVQSTLIPDKVKVQLKNE
jgi:LacI family transcriptional regulator